MRIWIIFSFLLFLSSRIFCTCLCCEQGLVALLFPVSILKNYNFGRLINSESQILDSNSLLTGILIAPCTSETRVCRECRFRANQDGCKSKPRSWPLSNDSWIIQARGFYDDGLVLDRLLEVNLRSRRKEWAIAFVCPQAKNLSMQITSSMTALTQLNSASLNNTCNT